MKSRGKVIEAYDQEHGGSATSTKTIRSPKPMQMLVLQFELLLSTNMESLLRLEVPFIQVLALLLPMLLLHAIPALISPARCQCCKSFIAIGGGAAGVGPAVGQPNAARQVPAPALRSMAEEAWLSLLLVQVLYLESSGVFREVFKQGLKDSWDFLLIRYPRP